MPKGPKSIHFNLDVANESDDEAETSPATNKKKQSKFKFLKSNNKLDISNGNATTQNVSTKPTAADNNEKKQKAKLVKYLSSEKQIVKQKFEIDREERALLDSLGNTAIDLDKYLKFPEAKAKDKLWRIPYFFSNDTVDDDGEDGLKSINRFGEGISDGCFVSLSLPIKRGKVDKDWQEIMDHADEVLEGIEQSNVSRMTRNRRGSILQPRHVFLSPNPELGNSEKLLLIRGHSLALRDWTSELFLGSSESGALLAIDLKQNICQNTSLDDLNQMPFPDLKGNMNNNNFNALTNSEMQYIQTVRSRRRQSLVPPNFDGQSDMQFRRQSFAGGELWSAKVEKMRKKEMYHQKVKLINPDFVEPPKPEASALEQIMLANQGLSNNYEDDEDYPEFSYESTEQALLFAHELTLIVRRHFIAVKESEIINFMTHSGPHVLNSCANIKGLFHLQNRIIRLIATYILRHEDLEERAEAILFFIQVIRQLYELGNWHSINVITQSLQCPPIVRLKDTWRKITFNYADEYCYFIQISEDLASGKQLNTYDSLKSFIAIFDDVVEKIKERCGFKIVQVHQHRLHKSWDTQKEGSEMMSWVNSEILDLLKDINGNLDEKLVDTNSLGKKPSITPSVAQSSSHKKPNFFHRYILCPLNGTLTKKQNKKAANKEESNPTQDTPKALAQPDEEQSEESDPSAIYQRRLLPGQILIRQPDKRNSKVPNCKKFWSIPDYNKLHNKDKEQVKNEMVRTLVAFQKKTFCVFEDRDENIKSFLLNAPCDSMDTCMLKSRLVEGDNKKESAAGSANKRRANKQTNGGHGIITYRSEHENERTSESSNDESPEGDIPPPETRTRRHTRTRRVMFAEDMDDMDSD